MAELFGWEIVRKKDKKKEYPSFVEPTNDDGAISVAAGIGSSSFIDMDGTARTEAELVTRYRSMLQQPEVSAAVDDIVNEAINVSTDNRVVECVTDDVDVTDSIKSKIQEEFENILRLLDFANNGYDSFMKWYVDGRINFHVIIDEKSPKKGIQELRYIDPRKIRKIREFEDVQLPNNNVTVKRIKNEYYIYNERGLDEKMSNISMGISDFGASGLKIAKDAILHCNSGLVNERNSVVLSHLHKAYKPLNQLRMME